MARILFAFLGAAQYQPAHYSFGGDARARHRTRFLPQALVAELARSDPRKKLDRVVLCGTATSGWQALAEALANPTAQPERGPELPTLGDAEIAAFAEPYSRALGLPVLPQRIDFGRTPEEQQRFVEMVAAHVQDGDVVHFDFTHGLRHLPLLALIAALAVRTLKHASVEAIWYGPYDLRDRITGITEVIRLEGLLTMMDWLTALSVFDATGDMARFGPLMAAETGIDSAMLAEASFRERVMHPGAIRRNAAAVLDALQSADGGISALVRPELEKRLNWTRSPERVEEGLDLALQLAGKGGELRALTLAKETAVDRIANAAGISGRDASERVLDAAISVKQGPAFAFAKAFLDLGRARNDFVHVEDRSARRDPVYRSSAAFRQTLQEWVRQLRLPVPQALIDAMRAGKPR